MIDNPHFRLPLDGSFAEVEQGSPEEIAQCVEAIVRTPRGFRDDAPELGLPQLAFSEGGADPELVAVALAEHEPRAEQLVTEAPGLLDQALSIVKVSLYG